MDRLTSPLILAKAERTPLAVAQSAQPVLDLSQRAFTHRTYGIEVIGTWLLSEDGTMLEPCLALLPATRFKGMKLRPCLITLSQLHVWVDPPIGDEMKQALIALEYAIPLGKNPEVNADVAHIIHAIQSRLDDLNAIPPKAVGGTRIAEAILTTEAGTFEREMVIRHA